MTKYALGIVAGALLLAALPASAQTLHLRKADNPTRVTPISVAPCKLVNKNGKLMAERVGPWRPYQQASASGRQTTQAATTIAVDLYEFDFSGSGGTIYPTELASYGTNCGLGGARWYLTNNDGSLYRNTTTYDDMNLFPGTPAGQLCPRVGLAWYQGSSTEDTQIAILTTQNWVTTSGDPNNGSQRGDLGGIIYNFGTIGATGFFISDVDTTSNNLFFTMPNQTLGGWIEQFLTSNGTAFAALNQPMLWGTKTGNPSYPNSKNQWDSSQNNGTFINPTDFQDYTFGVCPDPLSSMVTFLYAPSVQNEYAPTDYVASRGTEVGQHDPLKLKNAGDGSFVTISQKLQVSPALANAEITATLIVGSPNTVTGGTVTVVVRANDTPFSDPTCTQKVSLKNWNTNVFDVLDTRKPTSSFSTITITLTQAQAATYINQSTGEMDVRVGEFHGKPLSAGWTEDTDQIHLTTTR